MSQNDDLPNIANPISTLELCDVLATLREAYSLYEHLPAASLGQFCRILRAINLVQQEILHRFIAAGNAGANADISHPLRKEWEACRAAISFR